MPNWEVLHLFIPQLCSELCRFPSSLFEGCFSLHIITSCCSSGFDRLSCPWSDRWLVIWSFLCPDIRSLGSSFWTLGFPHCLPPPNPHAIYNPQRTRVGKGVIVSSYKQNIHTSLMSCPPSWSHFMVQEYQPFRRHRNNGVSPKHACAYDGLCFTYLRKKKLYCSLLEERCVQTVANFPDYSMIQNNLQNLKIFCYIFLRPVIQYWFFSPLTLAEEGRKLGIENK